jgi:hypothetical protein
VDQLCAAVDQDPSNEKAAVAVGGIFFATEQGDAKLIGAAFKTVDAAEELGAFGDLSVEGPAIPVVEGLVPRATADDIAKIEIACSRLSDRIAESFAVEVRDPLGIGVGAGVDEDFNAIRGEKFEEVVRWVRRVTDGVKTSHLASFRVGFSESYRRSVL